MPEPFLKLTLTDSEGVVLEQFSTKGYDFSKPMARQHFTHEIMEVVEEELRRLSSA